jgi:predicted O-methyltransferase YrrM
VFKGEFAETILMRWPGRLILVDAWRHMADYLDSWNVDDRAAEQNLAETRQRLARFGDRAEIWRMESGEAAARVPDGSLDFVYIDANHSYEAVKRDLRLWYPKVRGDGLMSGHDYFDARADKDLEPDYATMDYRIPTSELTSYGARSAVDQFAKRHGYKVAVTKEELPSWYFRKA